jgi:chemotaxis protein methyltransferase CheR
MKTEDFDLFQTLLKQRSGLVLSRDKVYLLESRLLPVARKWQIRGLPELAEAIRTRREEALIRDVTEAMTTNESSFYRDQKPFELFRSFVLPTLMKTRAGGRRLRIWSAACSTGQEPYSLAMILHEERAKLAGWSFEILGTDLSHDVLERARAGVYTQFEVQRGMPITQLVQYFKQVGDKWELVPEIRRMVTYRQINLIGELGQLGTFDIVFCRNVLIYFDQPTKTRVLESISKLMAPDAMLFLGGAETVLGITDRFKPVDGQRGIYQLAAPPSTVARQTPPGLAQAAAG